jgi:hypothetical protein
MNLLSEHTKPDFRVLCASGIRAHLVAAAQELKHAQACLTRQGYRVTQLDEIDCLVDAIEDFKARIKELETPKEAAC